MFFLICNERLLNLERSRLYVHGGAIALGHPTGCSGIRIVITGYHALKRMKKEFAVCGICGGGGVTCAMVIQNEVRNFVQKEISPLVEEGEENGKFPVQLFPMMGELGFLCSDYPEEYGGLGTDKITECIIVEELHRVSAGIGGAVMVQGGLGTYPILKYGSKEQKEKYLKPAIAGQKISSFSLTEPDAGSDVANIKATAKKDGDSYILNGSKTFITNGPIADYTIFVGYTDVTRKGQGINLFIVDKGTPGFEQCEETLIWGRIIYGARCVGLLRAILEETKKFATNRTTFNKPISKFQINSFRLAEMEMYIDIIRTITYRAAFLHEQGFPCKKEASIVKLFSSEAVRKMASYGMQMHGGWGLMMEYPIQRYWRDASAFTITEGTSEIQHLIISREMGI